ncbi:hypothetical protein, partial [Exilibacterium tricleocarpae]|uniref:hypothetical protein n=1 Tax=Exilibacterium tricleocarpae TaxID=2591008 RepID=UPI0015D0E6B6
YEAEATPFAMVDDSGQVFDLRYDGEGVQVTDTGQTIEQALPAEEDYSHVELKEEQQTGEENSEQAPAERAPVSGEAGATALAGTGSLASQYEDAVAAEEEAA